MYHIVSACDHSLGQARIHQSDTREPPCRSVDSRWPLDPLSANPLGLFCNASVALSGIRAQLCAVRLGLDSVFLSAYIHLTQCIQRNVEVTVQLSESGGTTQIESPRHSWTPSGISDTYSMVLTRYVYIPSSTPIAASLARQFTISTSLSADKGGA